MPVDNNDVSSTFSLPPLIVDRLDVALDASRYMVTLVGQGKRLMVTSKVADVIEQLKQHKTIEEAARDLSEAWGWEIGSEDLRFIIEQQLVSRGIAFAGDTAPRTPSLASQAAEVKKSPLYLRLLAGRFRWRLLPRNLVRRVCPPMSVLYEPLSIVLAVVLIAASRYMLYTTIDGEFLRQVTGRATAVEYLLSLVFLLTVVLIHEFGHAAAQVRFGLKTGAIGFQLYHYIPAFFADVSNSWKLKPRQRVAVDIGGIYFQSIAASVMFLIYMNTDYVPLLAAVVASDTLCLFSINPLMKFDGYWLLADILAVPNLQQYSERVLRLSVGRLFGRRAERPVMPVKAARATVLLAYALVRNIFWLLVAVMIVRGSSHLYSAASTTLSRFYSAALRGIEVSDWALVVSSVVRTILFVLLLMTMVSLLFGVSLKVMQLGRRALASAGVWKMSGGAVAGEAQH
ncbi:MAG TPA: hypothetical protein VJH03_23915 [Blastocatellia bacterium]|nr:hypothetical protein [Blastocatellia bacterium]